MDDTQSLGGFEKHSCWGATVAASDVGDCLAETAGACEVGAQAANSKTKAAAMNMPTMRILTLNV